MASRSGWCRSRQKSVWQDSRQAQSRQLKKYPQFARSTHRPVKTQWWSRPETYPAHLRQQRLPSAPRDACAWVALARCSARRAREQRSVRRRMSGSGSGPRRTTQTQQALAKQSSWTKMSTSSPAPVKFTPSQHFTPIFDHQLYHKHNSTILPDRLPSPLLRAFELHGVVHMPQDNLRPRGRHRLRDGDRSSLRLRHGVRGIRVLLFPLRGSGHLLQDLRVLPELLPHCRTGLRERTSRPTARQRGLVPSSGLRAPGGRRDQPFRRRARGRGGSGTGDLPPAGLHDLLRGLHGQRGAGAAGVRPQVPRGLHRGLAGAAAQLPRLQGAHPVTLCAPARSVKHTYNHTLPMHPYYFQYSMIAGRERVAVFHFERGGLGLALFTAAATRIQCSRVNSLCRLAHPQLAELAASCATLLTNAPLHELFAQLDTAKTALVAVERAVEPAITEHSLSKLAAHVTALRNPSAYFRKMAESGLKFSALGVLLQHLEARREVKLYLEDIDFFTDSLLQLVGVGEEELGFLEVRREDVHPSLIKGKGHSKEGYSLLSAYEGYLASTASKRILRYLLLNPTYDRALLDHRLDLLDWIHHHLRDHQLAKHFRNVHLLEGVLRKFGRMNAEEEDWRKLMRTLEAMIDVAALLRLPDPPPLVRAYTEDRQWGELVELYSIFKETFEFGPFGIRSGIDLTLDQLKQTYDSMPQLLTLIARQQQWELDFRIVFLAQVGYLVKLDPAVQLPPAFDDWELQFSNNSGRFYSNPLTEALDRQYGDTFGEIQDIEKKIVFDMEALVVERSTVILALYWQLCEIECFWGVAQASRSMCRPRLSAEALLLAHAWHPLLAADAIRNHAFAFPHSQAPRHRVCNSERNLVHLGYSNRCAILTGPNASGKTVYMKQVGVAVYLAHCGFFVPASLAEVPLVDSILCVGKAASIYNDQSCGFHSELSSLSALTQPYVLSNKSLVLIDELGSEVDYQNSLKLMYATVEYLTSSGSFVRNRLLAREGDEFTTPLVFIVTHLSEILNSRIIEESYRVRFLTMIVEQEGICLYKIRPGLVARGYGLRTAKQIMPTEFIALTEKYMDFIQEA